MRELEEITKIREQIKRARSIEQLEKIRKRLTRRLRLYTTKYEKARGRAKEKWARLISEIRGLLISIGRKIRRLKRRRHDYVEFTFTGYYDEKTKHEFEARIWLPIRSDLIPYGEEIPETRIRTLFEHYRWLSEQLRELLKEKRRLERLAVINMALYLPARYTYTLYTCLLDIVSKIEGNPVFRRFLDKCLETFGVKYKKISVSLYIPVDTLKELIAITSCLLQALNKYHRAYLYQYRMTEEFARYMLDKAREIGRDRFIDAIEQTRLILAFIPTVGSEEEWLVAYELFREFLGKLVSEIERRKRGFTPEFYRERLRTAISRQWMQELLLLRDFKTLIFCMDKQTGGAITDVLKQEGISDGRYLDEFEKVLRSIAKKGYTGELAERYKTLARAVGQVYRTFYKHVRSWINEATEEARRRQEEIVRLPEIEKQIERIREEARRIAKELEKERKRVKVEDVTPIVLDLLYEIMVEWYVNRLPTAHSGMIYYWDVMKQVLTRVGIRILKENITPSPEHCTILAEVRCKEHPSEVYRVRDCVWNWKEKFKFLVEDWFIKECDIQCEKVSVGYLEEPRYKRYTRRK